MVSALAMKTLPSLGPLLAAAQGERRWSWRSSRPEEAVLLVHSVRFQLLEIYTLYDDLLSFLGSASKPVNVGAQVVARSFFVPLSA